MTLEFQAIPDDCPTPTDYPTPPYGVNGVSGYRGQPRAIILAEAQGWRCAYCPTIMTMPTGDGTPRPTTVTVDHYIAKASGGANGWHNEIAACFACNTSKGYYSAMLFWLLMQIHAFNRRFVRKRLANMTTRQRYALRRRLQRDLSVSQADTDGPQCEGDHGPPHPPPQRVPLRL